MLSRVADSLYWLNRYLERAENTARLTSVYYDLILELDGSMREARFRRMLDSIQMNSAEIEFNLENALHYLISDSSNPMSLVSSVNNARENARQVREQISSELWQTITQLYLDLKQPTSGLEIQPQVTMQTYIRQLYLIGGVADTTMTHNEGWHFICLGRYLERALNMLTLLDVHFSDVNSAEAEAYLDWVALLKSCTAFEAYINVYTADITPKRIAEFLLLNNEFPHSVSFSSGQMANALRQISHLSKSRRSDRLNRRAGRLHAEMQYGQIDEIMSEGLHNTIEDLRNRCYDLHSLVNQVYITFPIAEELPQ